MEAKYEKNRYYAHDFKGHAVMGESFEHLKAFKDFAKEHSLQVCFCPMNHASVMVKNYRVLTPNQYGS